MEPNRSIQSITDVADLARRVLEISPQLTRRQAIAGSIVFLSRKAAA